MEGAVTVNSEMMGPMLSNVPIFAGFMDVLGRSRPEPRMIVTPYPRGPDRQHRFGCRRYYRHLDTHRGACIIVMDTTSVRGSLETL